MDIEDLATKLKEINGVSRDALKAAHGIATRHKDNSVGLKARYKMA
jgi:hypothetical protein